MTFYIYQYLEEDNFFYSIKQIYLKFKVDYKIIWSKFNFKTFVKNIWRFALNFFLILT